MADSGTPILNLLPVSVLLDADVLPLARPSGTTAPGTNLGITGAALRAQLAGGSLLWRAGGVDGTRGYRAGQLLRNSAGVDFYYAADIANPQAEPLLLPAVPATDALVHAVGGTAKADLNAAGKLALAQRAVASATEIGNVRVGAGLRITPNGALSANALNYVDEVDVAVSGAVGPIQSSNIVRGGLIPLVDYGQASAATQALVLGQLLGFRAVGPTPSVLDIGGQGGTGTIDGAGSLALVGPEAVWLKVTAAGYSVVLDTRRAPADSFAVLPYAASIAVDFNTATVRTLAVTGPVAYGTSLNVALLKTKRHYLTNTTGTDQPLSFPAGWKFAPSRPTTLAAGKEAVLTLECLGTTDATIKAAYAVLN